MKYRNKSKGFTLLELLIVIAIIAILAVIIVLVLNPSETLKKARDTQRMSDLNTVKTALALYLSSTNTPYLGSASANTACRANSGAWAAGDKIFYSVGSDQTAITDATLDGGTGSVPVAGQTTSTLLGNIDGTGWIPVNLDSLADGSPLSNFPIDPNNTIVDGAAVADTDYVYRYVCQADKGLFELNARLESNAYTVDDNKMSKDGGNNSNLFEVGTSLKILGAGTDF
jgi:type IV pilus assembly protein PilA